MGQNQAGLWAEYEFRLKAEGVDRDTPMPDKKGHGCSVH